MERERPDTLVVLTVLQGKETDSEVVSAACAMAKRRGARLRGLYVLEIPQTLPLGTWDEEKEARARSVLEEAQKKAGQDGCSLEGRVLPTRHAGQAIVDEAVESSAIGIVMAKPHPSRGGDAVSHVLDRAVCGVLVWRQEGRGAACQGQRASRGMPID